MPPSPTPHPHPPGVIYEAVLLGANVGSIAAGAPRGPTGAAPRAARFRLAACLPSPGPAPSPALTPQPHPQTPDPSPPKPPATPQAGATTSWWACSAARTSPRWACPSASSACLPSWRPVCASAPRPRVRRCARPRRRCWWHPSATACRWGAQGGRGLGGGGRASRRDGCWPRPQRGRRARRRRACLAPPPHARGAGRP
jgi:hypothetical protein